MKYRKLSLLILGFLLAPSFVIVSAQDPIPPYGWLLEKIWPLHKEQSQEQPLLILDETSSGSFKEKFTAMDPVNVSEFIQRLKLSEQEIVEIINELEEEINKPLSRWEWAQKNVFSVKLKRESLLIKLGFARNRLEDGLRKLYPVTDPQRLLTPEIGHYINKIDELLLKSRADLDTGRQSLITANYNKQTILLLQKLVAQIDILRAPSNLELLRVLEKQKTSETDNLKKELIKTKKELELARAESEKLKKELLVKADVLIKKEESSQQKKRVAEQLTEAKLKEEQAKIKSEEEKAELEIHEKKKLLNEIDSLNKFLKKDAERWSSEVIEDLLRGFK